ncbi:restriction endonuclease subunit S [Variovorax sp. LT1P1]|uniref:restriction endonuclease subunit S n=1 Tax=Variovorax sp. LT1P1 TaxID=3443730 RepID=UPI003F4734B0
MLKTRWPAVPIEDLCARVTSGGTPSRSNPAYYDDGSIPWIKTGELRGWYVDDIAERITPAAVRESSAKVFPPETVLLAMYGDGKTMGSVGLVRTPAATNQACCAMLADPQKCDPKFLMYSLVYFKPAILKLAISGAQRNLNGKSIKQFPIGAPPVEVQQRVASILSAYDDLIENNTRRIAILEEMARRIYEEWFVRFRFPGHEGLRMVESELGLVPEGWAIEVVEDVTETLGGGTPSKTESGYWDDGEINWYSPTDLTAVRTVFMEESASKITALGLAKSSAKLFPANSVMMTSRATLGVIAVNTTPACTNQGFIVCVPSDRMPLWLLFHWLKANEGEFEALATGATFKEIAKGVFRKVKLVVPATPTAAAFEGVVGPMMDLVLCLERKNRNLRAARDLLLPKLISGELDVSAMPEPEALAA